MKKKKESLPIDIKYSIPKNIFHVSMYKLAFDIIFKIGLGNMLKDIRWVDKKESTNERKSHCALWINRDINMIEWRYLPINNYLQNRTIFLDHGTKGIIRSWTFAKTIEIISKNGQSFRTFKIWPRRGSDTAIRILDCQINSQEAKCKKNI